MRNLFLTGRSGVGKTTAIFRALRTSGLDYGGFVVKRRIERSRRTSMEIIDLSSGMKASIASFSPFGKVAPIPTSFVTVGVPAIASALRDKQLVVMDELGRFELGAPEFMQEVFRALDSPTPVVGVLKAESNPFLDSVRARPDVTVIPVSEESREYAYALLVKFFLLQDRQ
ncbi:MAG: nucleoside-triphosphatase [Bacillota bacterium]